MCRYPRYHGKEVINFFIKHPQSAHTIATMVIGLFLTHFQRSTLATYMSYQDAAIFSLNSITCFFFFYTRLHTVVVSPLRPSPSKKVIIMLCQILLNHSLSRTLCTSPRPLVYFYTRLHHRNFTPLQKQNANCTIKFVFMYSHVQYYCKRIS